MITEFRARVIPLSAALSSCEATLSPDDMDELIAEVDNAYTWGDTDHTLVSCSTFVQHLSCFNSPPDSPMAELERLLGEADFVDLAN